VWYAAGKGSKEAVGQVYRHERDEYERLVRLRKEAIQNLTKDETRAIRGLGA
jgi:hypothetical protein